MKNSILISAFIATLAGCASVPNGPSVAVMPAPGKPFDMFVAEDHQCRQFAQQSIGKTASDAGTDSAVRSIAAGTAIGAAAGVLGGGQGGVESGAAAGMLTGAMVGSNEARYSERESQRRYDIAYDQCMYAKGNQIPQAALYQPQVIYTRPSAPATSAAPTYYPPPPPPSTPRP